MITLFGIKNCDTVKKARSWLESHGCAHTFHDFRSDGLSAAQLNHWLQAVGKQALINTRSTSWKQLSAEQQARFDSDGLSAEARAIVLANPTLIKRPVVQAADRVLVGFTIEQYQSLL